MSKLFDELKNLEVILKEANEDDLEKNSPDCGPWTIGVDVWHRVHILAHPPDLDPWWLEPGNAEEIGFPYDLPDLKPGVYQVEVDVKSNSYPGSYWEPPDESYEFELKNLKPVKI